MEINSHEIFKEKNVAELNRYLADLDMKIVVGEELGDFTTYLITEGGSQIFETIYPKELLVKVAQLLPKSDVRLGRYEIFVGETDMSQETLVLKFKGD